MAWSFGCQKKMANFTVCDSNLSKHESFTERASPVALFADLLPDAPARRPCWSGTRRYFCVSRWSSRSRVQLLRVLAGRPSGACVCWGWRSEWQAPHTSPFPPVQMASSPDEGSPLLTTQSPCLVIWGTWKVAQGLPLRCPHTASPRLDHWPLPSLGPCEPRASAGGQSREDASVISPAC